MARTRENGFCCHHLPREYAACPLCARTSLYQNLDQPADNKERAEVEGQTSREKDPEQLLLLALGQGDQSAFWPLWEMHSSRLYEVCLREMNRNREDAEEALAKAMMKALTILPMFAPKIINPKAWLIRFTYNLCKDIYRGRARGQRTAARLERMAEVGDLPNTYGFARAPAEVLYTCEFERDPESTIDLLPAGLREVFVLRFLQEMSYKDIAARLTLTQVNVRKRIQQARAILRAQRDDPASANDASRARCSREEEANCESTRTTEAWHGKQEFEIPAHTGFSRAMCVHLPSGAERRVEIFLPKKPLRERQKIKTLRKYVERHASGWKNRLKLADLLYETGAWIEAVDAYRQLLKKQPWLIAVSVRLGEVLSLIATDEDALAVYELALPLAKQGATRCHLRGLIASCHRDFPLAVASFEEATTLEPNNAAHWRALDLTLQKAGSLDGTPLRFDEASRIEGLDSGMDRQARRSARGSAPGQARSRVDQELELASHAAGPISDSQDRRPGVAN